MASGKSTYWANKLLNQLFNAGSAIAPATLWLALYTVAPAAGGGGTEASGGGYVRLAVASNTTNWPAAAGGVISNAVALTFVTASADWSAAASMVAAAILDAVSAGNSLYFGTLTANKPVLNGDTASFAIAALTVTET